MSSTARHTALALLWLCCFAFVAALAMRSSELRSNEALLDLFAMAGTVVWNTGCAAIFFSWARTDAPDHGRSSSWSLAFAILWVFTTFASHILYLFVTRGLLAGLFANIKFFATLLIAAYALLQLVPAAISRL